MTVIINNAQVRNLHIGPTISRDGLMSYWDTASTYSYPRSGSVWYDLIGNNSGSMINMTSGNFSEEAHGSFVFDGTNEYVHVPTDDSLNAGSGAFTVTAWIKPEGSSMSLFNTKLVVNKRGRGGAGSYAGWRVGIMKTSSSYWGYAIAGLDDGTGNGPYSQGSTSYSMDTWHYIAAAYYADRSVSGTNSFVTYTNGQEDINFNVSTGIQSISNNVPFEIGATAIETGNPISGTLSNVFPGSIASVKFYKRRLTQNEINQDYLSQKGRFGL